MGAPKHPFLSRLLTVLLSTVAPFAGASAQNWGRVGAVNVDATGTPPGGSGKTLAIGNTLVHKERIETSAKGSTQVVFPDESTLNVGNNSDVVIDEFVYDPNAGTGKMALSATKGVLRFVGGQISHTAGATITTPSASLGIRGGIVTLMMPVPPNIAAQNPQLVGAAGQMLVIAHHGLISLTNSVSSVIIRPGFAVFIGSPAQPIGQPFRAAPLVLQQVTQQLTSHPGQHGGVSITNLPTPTMSLPPGFAIGQLPNPMHPPPGSDPLGYTSIFGAANNAARSQAQTNQTHSTPPPYP